MASWRLSKMCRQSAVLLAMLCVAMLGSYSVSASDISSKDKFNYDALNELLEKTPPSPAAVGRGNRDDHDNYSGSTPPISQSEIDAFRAKLNQCYEVSFLAASSDAGRMYAELSVELAKDGAVIGIPNINAVGPGASSQLAVLARKAILECAPYDMLPKDKYGSWRDVTLRFSVAGMQ